jgi:hypothetical protein
MRFRYIGDSDNMTAFGYDFSGGATPEITDPHAIRKLIGNRFFEAVEEVTMQEGSGEMPVKNKGGRPRKVQPTEA